MIIPADFIETTPPKVGTSEWYLLNYSQNEFGVNIVKGQLIINKVDEINRCELKIPTGTLIGTDKGEWGGVLTYYPSDTSEAITQIKRGNIKFLFLFKDKIYFIEGLAHLSSSKGALYELVTVNDHFTYNIKLDFDDAPEAFTIYKDKFLIATHENFYIVENFKKELIFKKTFWSSLYPNSIAILDDRNVFLGIRSGIVKLDLVNRTMKFYKNDK
jgi:hypothetical protein